jgi:hypothetical protein
MNVENYQRFLEAIGHRIITSSSGYWSDVAQGFYESTPPFRVLSLDQAEIDELFGHQGVIGLKYPAPEGHVGKRSWFYLCQGEGYDLERLHPKMRNKVRQGLRNCSVRPVSFECLKDHGLLLNQDTLKRQGRDDPTFSQPARWAHLCQAGHQIEGAAAWGAFLGDQLAAYMITFVIDGYCNILHQMSRLDTLASRANNALAFVATREMLASPGIKGVSYGQASIRELPGLEEYKVRLGYEKRPMRHIVVLHPLLKPVLLSRTSGALLGSLSRLFPDHDVVKRFKGTISVARMSQDVRLSSYRRTRPEAESRQRSIRS